MIKKQIKTILGIFFVIFIFTHCCKETVATTDISTDDYRLWSKGSCNRYYKILDAAIDVKPIWAADYAETILRSGDSTFKLRLDTHYLSGVPFENLLFTNIPLKERRFQIVETLDLLHSTIPACDYTTFKNVKGFETPIENLHLNVNNKANHITLTKVDKANNRIEGRFDLAFYSGSNKDTLYFKNGTFVAPYPIKL